MTERERLIELIIKSVGGCARYWAQCIADYLLANGGILPPCKVGDTVYVVVRDGSVHEDTITEIEISKDGIFAYGSGPYDNYNFQDFGKTVFFTKEEAEKAYYDKAREEG